MVLRGATGEEKMLRKTGECGAWSEGHVREWREALRAEITRGDGKLWGKATDSKSPLRYLTTACTESKRCLTAHSVQSLAEWHVFKKKIKMETDCNISFVRQNDSLLFSLHARGRYWPPMAAEAPRGAQRHREEQAQLPRRHTRVQAERTATPQTTAARLQGSHTEMYQVSWGHREGSFSSERGV